MHRSPQAREAQSDFGLALSDLFRTELNIRPPMALAFELTPTGHGHLLNLRRKVEAAPGSRGASGRQDFGETPFQKADTAVPTTPSRLPSSPNAARIFAPAMSILDLLTNGGPKAGKCHCRPRAEPISPIEA